MSLIPWRSKEVRWNPFTELDNLQDELVRFFDSKGHSSSWGWSPALDVIDSKKDMRIKADIPGLSKDDLDVSIDGNILTLRGEKKKESTVNDDGYVRSERTYGSFYRSITLPEGLETDAPQASYKNGVLELTFRKKKDAVRKQIDVTVD